MREASIISTDDRLRDSVSTRQLDILIYVVLHAGIAGFILHHVCGKIIVGQSCGSASTRQMVICTMVVLHASLDTGHAGSNSHPFCSEITVGQIPSYKGCEF